MINHESSVPPEVARRTAESLSFRLLGLLLERPRRGWYEEIDGLAREARDPDLRQAAAAAAGASEERYLALLGPGGKVSPRAVAYIGMEDPGKHLTQLMELYQAFGYDPLAEDPPDHVAVEVGFAAFLSLKAAHAAAVEDPDALASAQQIRGRFLAEHLHPLACSLGARVVAQPDVPTHLWRALTVLLGAVEPADTPE
jgi:nitrate reductase assembly molybdenum cofactor insertion protein NarJ